MKKGWTIVFALGSLLLVGGAGRATDLTGSEIPYHVVVENWLSLLVGIDEEDVPHAVGGAGLDAREPAAAELRTLHSELVGVYLERLHAGDPRAYCHKVSLMGRRLAEIHRRSAEGSTAPWVNVLALIDHRVRPGLVMVSSRSRSEARDFHRSAAACWAEGVLSVYSEGPVQP